MRYLLSVLTVLVLLTSCEDDPSIYSGNDDKYFPDDSVMKVKVTFIYDGDTFAFNENSYQYKVRVLGIDCFETQKNSRLSGQADKSEISIDSALSLGLEAKAFADSVLRGNGVTLQKSKYEPNTDVYDRLLRHVFIGGKRYDSLLIQKGLVVN